MTKSRHIAPPRRRWTDAEISTLRRNYPHFEAAKIAAQLGRTVTQVYAKANELGLGKSAAFLASEAACRLTGGEGQPWRFKPGHETWNKGVKGVCGLHPNTKANHFKPGAPPHGWKPIGSLRVTTEGYLQRKMTDTRHAPRDWVCVHRLVWEAAHGPVPADSIVAFKPGRKTTDEALITPDALECVTRRDWMARHTLHRLPKPLAELVQLRGVLNRKINRLAKAAEEGAAT